MKFLTIKYDRFRAELNVEKFFPCTQPKAKKLFPLVVRGCPEKDIVELQQYFKERIEVLERGMKTAAENAAHCPPKSKECLKYTAEFKSTKHLMKRLERNLKLLQDEVNKW